MLMAAWLCFEKDTGTVAPRASALRGASLVERAVGDEIDRGRRPIACNKALTEIPDKIIIRRFRPIPRNAAEAAAHALFHVEPRKFIDYGLYFSCGNVAVSQTDNIQADTGGAQGDFRLLIQSDRGRRVESDAIPNQLGAAIIEPPFLHKLSRKIGGLDFEPSRTGESLVERDIVQQCSHRDNFCVELDILDLSKSGRKQPRANDVIEQVRFAPLFGIADSTVDEQRVRNGDSSANPCCRSHRDHFSTLLPQSERIRVAMAP